MGMRSAQFGLTAALLLPSPLVLLVAALACGQSFPLAHHAVYLERYESGYHRRPGASYSTRWGLLVLVLPCQKGAPHAMR